MKTKFWSFLMLIVMMQPVMVACGDEDQIISRGDDLVIKAVGTWMCIESTDTQYGQSFSGLLVGKEITIKNNGTYTSTSPTFGNTGTYVISGNTITAKSSAGTFMVTVNISGDKMIWNGTASNGVTFKYIFQKEIQ